MKTLARRFVMAILVCVPAAAFAAGQGAHDTSDATAWAAVWDREHLPLEAPLWTSADVEREARRLVADAPDLFAVEVVATSLGGRPIHEIRTGHGPFGVLLWSQMHGDEPSATPALFDLLRYIERHRGEPVVGRLLERLTLHVVPMLNPDGAYRFERRNLQGIDINRDALRLQSPEGRALKALRDRYEPALGFNLHNQNWRTSVGRPPQPAGVSLLSVAFDEARTENEGRRLTKRVCAVIRDALEPLATGRIARYDDEFEVRAFGDNLTKWGTPVVLIETGPWPGPDPDRLLTRLQFVAIATALDAVASGRVNDADPARYESLPQNEDLLFHTVVRNATIEPGTGLAPFTGDIGVAVTRTVREGQGGSRRIVLVGRIEDIGDLRVYGALESIDATGRWVAPAPNEGVMVGDVVTLPALRARTGDHAIVPGEPAAFLILSPIDDDRYRIDRIVRFTDPAQ